MRCVVAVVATACVLCLPGCAGGAGSRDVATAPSPAVPVVVVADDGSEVVVSQRPPAVWDEASRQAAAAAGEAAVAAYARPDLGHEAWWAGVGPLMTQRARTDYVWVDPSRVPAAQVSGPGELVDEDSAWTARVRVPTDAGVWLVVLVRADGASPWLVARLDLPGSLG